jgi:RNA polymerase sigma-70 factor (ECF subfamily)
MQLLLESIDTSDDLERELDEEFQRELMDQAMHVVRRRVEPKSWKAFELLLSGRSGKEVAEQLSLSIAAVYMAKSRVSRMLANEVRALEPRS